TGRKVHGGGPSEIAIAPEDQDSHRQGTITRMLPAILEGLLIGGLFPPELTALRIIGLAVAVGIGTYAIMRRHSLRNADIIVLLMLAIGIAIFAGTELLDSLL